MEKKKSLGQHFLRGKTHLDAVADAAAIVPGETVLEIGPGEGTLTKVLLERGAKVIALEKDHRLIPVLTEKFAGQAFEVIEGDALEYDPAQLGKFTVIGNVPYYITGALFKKFLSGPHQPSTLVFLVQKEVAERIIGRKSAQGRSALGGKESILSLSVKAYGTPRYIKTVPKGAFVPPPKVDSAILAVTGISRSNFADEAHEKKFFELVRTGFGQKRKILASNLRPILKENTEALMQNAKIEPRARAEDLSLAQWLALSSS
jgi:16S rRNA (adenine1518-N6/adenine1519-N6)-dimethyltransferase